ncbi:AI-2E family transporter [Paenibacillus senegalensis]|uniref:AI-2E family transporter n=1 Tax=Paenibacillus senegalensis TaxID=1465766 RepID=UPI00028A37CB|nr:AI-2E family transporter [Paenibacillus senegalensis]
MLKYKKTIYLFSVIIITLLLYKLVSELGTVMSVVSSFLSILSPFFLAFVIAYLLRPIINFIEGKLKLRRFKRLISIVIVYVGVIGFILISFIYVTPRVYESIMLLLTGIPFYFTELNEWITVHILQSEWAERFDISGQAEEFILSMSSQISEMTTFVLNNLASLFINLTSTLINVVLGTVISIYMLKDKEKLAEGGKRLLYAFLPKERAERAITYIRDIDSVFSKYFAGIIFDSLLIGLICFCGLMLLNTPNALLASVVVGVSNVIPYFGPFVGMVFVTLITLFVSPGQALWAFLFVFLLQQFDGHYMGPKIYGSKVGISPLWVILAILIGGGTFGVMGMIISVPVFAILKTAFDAFVERRLSAKMNASS